jgi:D-arabinose 1-dehydrogenase-like Zn-dependent alcohol dehydrogenase
VPWFSGCPRLGHLGIQFASKMGFKTIAIGRGKDKGDLVKKLGATHYDFEQYLQQEISDAPSNIKRDH